MRHQFTLVFGVFLLLFAIAGPSNAETLTLYATHDATVDSQYPTTTSNGNWLNISNSQNTNQLWSFFKFDLSSLPNNADITTATFRMRAAGSWSTDSDFQTPYDRYPQYFHVADDSWQETSVSWDDMPDYGYYLGKSYHGSAFSASGASFLYPGIYDAWDYAADLLDDALSFVGMIPDVQQYSASYLGYSSESGVYTPQLYLEYTVSEQPPHVPEPSTFMLAALGLLTLVGLKRIRRT
ncbi:hypothetical protein JCM12178A_25240 [Salidesulfovibrio brasiliensis]